MSHNPEAYNKTIPVGHPSHGTLMGNWHEEQALRKRTGIGRTIPGEHYPKMRSTLYSSDYQFNQEKPRNNTFERVFPEPKMDLPLTYNQEYGQFDDAASRVRMTGKRFDLLEKQFLDQSLKDWEAKETVPIQAEYKTTYSTLHSHPGVNLNSIGRRVMSDIDGVPVPVERRDEDLLVEHKLLNRPQINTDNELRQLIDPTKHYSKDVPFTFWVEKQNQGAFYNSKIADHTQSFNRNNQFLKEFHHYTHKKL